MAMKETVVLKQQAMSDAHEKILQRQLDKIAKEHDYADYEIKIKPTSSDGANYTSTLFQATISAPNKKDLNLFAKVAAIGENFRAQMFIEIFDVEEFAYNNLAQIYEKIEKEYKVPDEYRIRMPKFYAFDGTYMEETLVLEDLTAQGFKTPDRLKSMDWEYASKSLEQLAKWHALSIVFQEDYPEEYKRAKEVFKLTNMEDSKTMAGAMLQAAKTALSNITDDEHRDKLRRFLEKYGNVEFMMDFYGPMKRPVLVHGDFRMSNIMYRPNKDNYEVVPVDYQCIHEGCGMRDVLFFLISGTDEEFRIKYFQKLLDHYFEQMCDALRRLKRDPAKVFPREDFDYEAKQNLPWSAIVATFVLPVVTVSSENAPKVNEDFGLEAIATVQTSTLYETRINGVVRDFARWGVI